MARVFLDLGECHLEASEEKAFGGAFLKLGSIRLIADKSDVNDLRFAIKTGRYEWAVPETVSVENDLLKIMDFAKPADNANAATKNQYEKNLDRIRRSLDAIACAAVRAGLVHPIFDARSVEEMPFRKATTVIADTSGVLQGGLDFVARFLHPAARIKIPAVVHMEIVNLSDGFLKLRRAAKLHKSALLLDHLLSQGGQRVLLRLEFRPDTDVERTLLLGDPLRNAFQKDSEQEWSDLNISVPLRSYCDRLIVEAVRQHQSHASPGHAINLLTSDQGLARMALAEGISPLYFRSTRSSDFFGRTLTGVAFHPFAQTLYRVPLHEVIWEFATAFGSARLVSPDRKRWTEIAAMGADLSWSPMHSRDDLLWIRSQGLPDAVSGSDVSAKSMQLSERDGKRKRDVAAKSRGRDTSLIKRSIQQSGRQAFYRVSVELLFRLIDRLASEHHLSEDRAAEIVGNPSKERFSEYRRFMEAGSFVTVSNQKWIATDELRKLHTSLIDRDFATVRRLLNAVPSFRSALEMLNQSIERPIKTFAIPESAEATYRGLLEVTCAGAPIPNEGFYLTSGAPSVAEFSKIALERFRELDTGDGLVSVGVWLEELIRKNAIHPVRTRDLLAEASAGGLLKRSTEGSTTDTRHDKHVLRVLNTSNGRVSVDLVHLYRGDFLIPNKSSSSIRLQGGA